MDAPTIHLRDTLHPDLDGTPRPCLNVFAGDRFLGQAMELSRGIVDRDGIAWRLPWWWVKPKGAPWFYPTSDGLRSTAISILLREIDRVPPMRSGIPHELVISQLRREQERADG